MDLVPEYVDEGLAAPDDTGDRGDFVQHYAGLAETASRGPSRREAREESIAVTPGRTAPPGMTPRPAAPADPDELTFVWGTNISVEVLRDRFERYLRGTPGDNAPSHITSEMSASLGAHFRGTVLRMQSTGSHTFELDCTLLRRHDPQLFQMVSSHPAECVPLMSQVFSVFFMSVTRSGGKGGAVIVSGGVDEFSGTVAPFRLPKQTALRDLSPQHTETLVAVRGMVVRTTKIIPEIRLAHFRCWACFATETSMVDQGRISEPVRCQHCGKQYSFQLMHSLSMFEDKQIIRIQEAPENLAEGELPVTLSVVAYGDMVDTVVPGDRITATGIYRNAPMRLNSNTRIIRNVFRSHLDALHLLKASKTSQTHEESNAESAALREGGAQRAATASAATGGAITKGDALAVTSDEKDRIMQLSRLPDIYDILIRSLAPGIWGHDDVKAGVLAQLFGASKKQFQHGSFRAELNILLCGDPGVAKSQLLTRVHRISPRGVYASGKGSSSVGLTAFVVKDADTGEFVLEPGALVLSDRGMCCIDEFDKMNEATRSVLHEVMEQQTLSIAKAGIIAQLNARTSILAAANPKESQWNPALNIVENLQIEPTLLSRFDLIFLLLDHQDEAQDRQLAAHVLALYLKPSDSKMPVSHENAAATAGAHPWLAAGRTLTVSHFTKYVAYAREFCNPAITEASHKALAAAYVELRKVRGGGKTVSATLRQLESMIRLSEARAKMRLAATVTIEDVTEAKNLISTALREAATDPRTGLINMDMFVGPDLSRSSLEANLARVQMIAQSKFIAMGRSSAQLSELRHLLNEQLPRPLPNHQLTEVLSSLAGGDVIESFNSSVVRFVMPK